MNKPTTALSSIADYPTGINARSNNDSSAFLPEEHHQIKESQQAEDLDETMNYLSLAGMAPEDDHLQ